MLWFVHGRLGALLTGLMLGLVLAHVVDFKMVQTILKETKVSGGIYLRSHYTLPKVTENSSCHEYHQNRDVNTYASLNSTGVLKASLVLPSNAPTALLSKPPKISPSKAPQKNPSKESTTKNPKPPSGFCGRLPQGATATKLWKQHADRIIQATRADIAGPLIHIPDVTYPSWLKGFFTFMHTRFLRLGYKHPPLPTAMKRVLEIVDAAMQKKEGSRPLNVVVVGGSVAQGRNSCNDPFQKNALNETSYGCKWSHQIQKLCDEFLGNGVVRVVNLAVGGTGTDLSTTIIKYKLYPDTHQFLRDQGPDIIINAYSTNDAGGSDKFNYTYHPESQAMKRETAQQFIRACQDAGPCVEPPMVVYLDDYLGNRNNLILAENSNGWLTQEMSEWYGAMFISYASAVRRLVYANQQAGILSSYWLSPSTNGTWPIEVHFGLTAHIALTWVTAFSFLSAAVDFCDDGYDDHMIAKVFPGHYPQARLNLAERVTPPPLNGNTQLKTVSKLWLKDARTVLVDKASKCNRNHNQTQPDPCAITFMAGPVGIIRNRKQLETFLEDFSMNSSGWIAEDSNKTGWKNKIGYVANMRHATTTFYRASTPSIVRTLKLYYLKSYGPKWQDSRAKVTFHGMDGNSTLLEKSFTLEAFHDSETSVSYEYQLNLSPKQALPANTRVEVTIQLINGTSFKLLGLVICDRP